MFHIDLKSRVAIYEQIVEGFKRLIITGVLPPQSKVPSVREMAGTLTVNPNTVQKAYRTLESAGYIYTVLGQGSFVSDPPDIHGTEVAGLYATLRQHVQELLFRGETMPNILAQVQAEGQNHIATN